MFKLTNDKLTDEMINQYRMDRSYGCYTRNCLELEIWPAVSGSVKYVIFADIDQMRDANERYGYNGVNDRIKAALNAGRDTDIHVARWFSGDELVFLLQDGPRSGNPLSFCERIQSRLKIQGLSATLGIVEIQPDETQSPTLAVDRAAKLVQNAKKAGQRASILAEAKLISEFTSPSQPISVDSLFSQAVKTGTALLS
jgi:GGDEF domain-containing protein